MFLVYFENKFSLNVSDILQQTCIKFFDLCYVFKLVNCLLFFVLLIIKNELLFDFKFPYFIA